MTEAEKQARFAEIKKIPRQVQLAVLFAFILGLVTFLRVVARAYATHLSMGKGVLFGLLMLCWFWICSGSLYSRSRWGYVVLIGFILVPLLGLFTLSIHLLRLALEGALTVSWPETLHCSTAVLQLVVTCILFRHLLAKQVRDYVWKPAAVADSP